MSSDRGRREAARVDNVMSRVPDDILQALNEDQIARLRTAIAEARPWRNHPIDIRLSLPLFAQRLFITLVGGTDQRGANRRAQERVLHPVATGTNLVFLGIAVVVLYAIAGLIALLVAAAVRGG